MSSKSNKELYFPELDGTRAVAFLTVFVYHVGMDGPAFAWLSRYIEWGWSSVELFFALSGFLITLLLLREKQASGSINIRNFYVRRALRIWPLYLTVVITAALFPLLHPNLARMDLYCNFLRMLGPYFCFAGNFSLIANFGDMVRMCKFWHLSPMTYSCIITPLWSVSVEEQFYLVWPLVLLAINRKRTLWITMGAVYIISLFSLYQLRTYAAISGHGYSFFYYNTMPHLGSFMLGAAIALAEISHPGWAKKLFAGPKGFLIPVAFALFVYYLGNFCTPIFKCASSAFWLFAALSLMAGGLLLSALNFKHLRNALSTPVLVYIGQRTYGLYMFHFWLTSPAVSRHWQAFLPPIILQYVPHFILTFLLAFALAEISWCCLESPMLSLRKHFRSKAKPIEVQSRVAELSAAAR